MTIPFIIFIVLGCKYYAVAIRIRGCSSTMPGYLELTENQDHVVTCEDIPGTDKTVIWERGIGQPPTYLLAGTCDSNLQCSERNANVASLSRPYFSTSIMTLKNISRDVYDGGGVRCYTSSSSNETASCNINVIFPAQMETTCQTDIIKGSSPWMVNVTCRVVRAYAVLIDGYKCIWVYTSSSGSSFQIPDSQTQGIPHRTPVAGPSPNYPYYSYNCSIQVDLPDVQGRQNYHVTVYPGSIVGPTTSINIDVPDENPVIGCNVTNGYIAENSSLICSCTIRDFGQPMGSLRVYRAGSAVVDNAAEGRNVTFTLPRVNRQNDNEILTCALNWVRVMTTIYTLSVAYGPDTVALSDPGPIDLNPVSPGKVNLTCTATVFKPSVSYVWTGACDSFTTSTCTFTPTVSNDGNVITCTVINTVTNVQITSYGVTLNLRYPPTETPKITGYNNQAVNENTQLTLNCSVAGGKPKVASVTISCGDRNITSNGTSTAITVTADYSRYGRGCQCSAIWQDKFPSWYNQTAHVTFNVSYGPRSVSLYNPGPFYYNPYSSKTLTLTCTVTGYNPSVTYQWSRPCNNFTSSTCTFTPTPSFNGDVISCTAINTVTGARNTSSITLIVYYPPDTTPEIKGDSDQFIYDGDDVTINCSVADGNPPVTSVTLTCGGVKNMSLGTTTPINFKANSSFNNQQCMCKANWENKTELYNLTKNVFLTVYYPPMAPNISTVSRFPFMDGESPTMECSFPPGASRGNPQATLTWQGQQWMSSQNESRLTLTSLKGPMENNRTVVCQASNNFTIYKRSNISAEFRLQVYYLTEVDLLSLNDTVCRLQTATTGFYCVVKEGDTVRVNCTANGNPAVKHINWNSNSKSTLDIAAYRNTSVEHICNVTTDVVNGDIRLPLTKYASLYIYTQFPSKLGELTINSNATNMTVNEGEQVKLTCTGEGRPTPAMRLGRTDSMGLLDSKDQGPDNSFADTVSIQHTIGNATCSDATQYTCRANNEMSALYLRVNCYPRNLVLKYDEPFNVAGNTLLMVLDFVAYPMPLRYNFIFLGQSKNLSVAVREDLMFMNCSETTAVYIITCNISVVSTNSTLPGYYKLIIENDFGSAFVTYEFDYKGKQKEQTEDHKDVALIGGVAAATVICVFIVLAVVGVIVYKKRTGPNVQTNREATTVSERSDSTKHMIPDYVNFELKNINCENDIFKGPKDSKYSKATTISERSDSTTEIGPEYANCAPKNIAHENDYFQGITIDGSKSDYASLNICDVNKQSEYSELRLQKQPSK